MPNSKRSEIIVTGLGVISPVGQGKVAFLKALLAGDHRFAVMERPGRQHGTSFIGAEIAALKPPGFVGENVLRSASFSSQVALSTLAEAWEDAQLERVDAARIGLVIGGSNLQQRDLVLAHARYADKVHFLRATYGVSFFDTDICGLCTSAFGIRGMAYTVGGASASGQLAVIEAAEAVESGRVDVCIGVGALMDLSYWECQAFRALGAMGSTRYAKSPELACRPFDGDRDGFVYGENCAAVVVERAGARAIAREVPYARLGGWSVVMDANRNPDPSLTGEVTAIERALGRACMTARDIDYVNPHGSGSVVGDAVELEALQSCRLTHAAINSTKSITGHGLSAAGAIEIVATALQFAADELHPCRNLETPLSREFDWVRQRRRSAGLRNSLTLSFGFGGLNTALVMSKYG
jgi:malonyl-ACP decarboxylase